MTKETKKKTNTKKQTNTKKTKSNKTAQKSKTTKSTKTKKELNEELKKLKKENEYLKDTLLRARADLDNFKKRTEREVSRIIENANADLIKKILPIIDNLERSLDPEHTKSTNGELYKGIELIYKNLLTTLEEEGLEPMQSIGEPFEVEFHDAIMQVKKEGIESDIVLEEHQKGYFLNGKVLRHAKVVVSK